MVQGLNKKQVDKKKMNRKVLVLNKRQEDKKELNRKKEKKGSHCVSPTNYLDCSPMNLKIHHVFFWSVSSTFFWTFFWAFICIDKKEFLTIFFCRFWSQ
jgi:hypothetical protein